MALPDVLAFLELTDELGLVPWLDGGWAVDALLGEQTRRHEDLDIFLEARHAPLLAQHLHACGFEPVPRPDTRPWNFVLGDRHGREIDLHLVELEPDGTARFGPEETLPAAVFGGYGVIGGRAVRCIAPEWEVRFHTGYAVDEQDWQDVSALCARFGIPVPPDYDGFVGGPH